MKTPLFDTGSPSGPKGASAGEDRILTVSRLNALVKQNLEEVFGSVCVRGEISNLSTPASGHAYFTLKDENAEISAVWFRSKRIRSGFSPREGDAVTAKGTVSLYAPRGTYQIIISSMKELGKGDLREQFEKLARRLREEGLFDEQHKKNPPFLPETVGIITSGTGAAVKDIVNVIRSRFPGARIVIGPVAVQGKNAPGEICRMIGLFNAWGEADVLIVGRGGGSLEDLWAFNDEAVARAVFGSDIPVISAVGHETDVTISDLAADVRALTPTQAGEIAVPDVMQENQRLDILTERSGLSMKRRLSALYSRLNGYRTHRIFEAPGAAIRMKLLRAAGLARRFCTAGKHACTAGRKMLDSWSGMLESLNPLSVLKRGFSYTVHNGKPVTDAEIIAADDILLTRFYRGTAVSRVTEIKDYTDG